MFAFVLGLVGSFSPQTGGCGTWIEMWQRNATQHNTNPAGKVPGLVQTRDEPSAVLQKDTGGSSPATENP